jgi:cytochrome bd-type quinol oxidase subunit 2
LAGGVLFVLLCRGHGALCLPIRARGELQERAASTARRLWPILAAVIVLFLVYTFLATRLFVNYLVHPALFLILVVPVGGLVLMRTYLGAGRYWLAWGASAVMIIGVSLFAVVGLYPALLPSSLTRLEPDRHRRRIEGQLQPPDPDHHAGGGAHLRAHRHRLPVLGLQALQPPHHRGGPGVY